MMELSAGADQDADGTIGTISHDGYPDNDPLFITGRVDTSSAPSGLRLTPTADGYSPANASTRRIWAAPADG